MKTTLLIITLAIIVATLGVGSILLDIPQSEPEKLLTSFIIWGCLFLISFGIVSIVVVKIESYVRKRLEELEQK